MACTDTRSKYFKDTSGDWEGVRKDWEEVSFFHQHHIEDMVTVLEEE